MECKCYIKEDDGVEPQIIKCPLCKSALDMYKALETYFLWTEGKSIGSRTFTQVRKMMMDARTKAED